MHREYAWRDRPQVVLSWEFLGWDTPLLTGRMYRITLDCGCQPVGISSDEPVNGDLYECKNHGTYRRATRFLFDSAPL